MARKSRKRKTRRKRKYKGGAVSMDFERPSVNATTPSQALDGSMHDQKVNAENVVELNKAMAGGGDDIVVPQMGIAAGEEGNNSIASSIGSTLKGRADGEFDSAVSMEKPTQLGGYLDANHIGTAGRLQRMKNNMTKMKKKQEDLKAWHSKSVKDKRDALKNMGSASRNLFGSGKKKSRRRRKSRRRKSKKRKSKRRRSRRRSRRR